jgi:hypothetical protein
MKLDIRNDYQFRALVSALDQYVSNQAELLAEEEEEGRYDSDAWEELWAAEGYLDKMNAALASLADSPVSP